MNSLRRHFLVASPHLLDPNFYRSVVLMIEHDEEGAFGLVLNRPTRHTVAELLESQPEDVEATLSAETLYYGGPVQGPLMALHTVAALADVKIMDDVYFTSSEESLQELFQRHVFPLRLFLGYSGWGGGQLESELEAGGWLTCPASEEEIFAGDEQLWKRITSRIGLEILANTVRPKHIPEDVSLN